MTVPLGALADAYLDALATLDSDRLGNISAFVAVASQLILIKSRAMLPRRPETTPGVLPEDEPDPEAELRARLLLYRAHRDAGRAPAGGGHSIGSGCSVASRRSRERRASRAPARRRARRSTSRSSRPRSPGWPVIVEPPVPPAEIVPRTITLTERAAIIRAALRGATSIVLQDLLAGVRDRVVVAVTFLAMLELMKRREIVVTQDEPWGPIVARATTAEERGRGARCRTRRSTRAWSRSRDRGAGRSAGRAGAGGRSGHRSRPGRRAALRGPARGTPVRRGAPADPARDRHARGRRSRDGRRASRRPRGRAGRSRDPARAVGRPRRARHVAGRGCAHRPLRRRRRHPPLAGRARDARDRRVSPARHQVGRGADPRRRLGLHDPLAAPSAARRRAGPVGVARPAVPVRHGLRVPRALRPDESRGAAAARRRGGGPADRGGGAGRHGGDGHDRRRGRLDRRRIGACRPDAESVEAG